MTCLVAVMNARGVALAADSAITLTDDDGRKKIYQTAEKLFSIAHNIPVGIMVFDSADMMGIPWETIVNGFAQRLGTRPFDTLEQYAANFFAFMEGSAALFPPPRQAEYVKRVAWSLFSYYREQMDEAVAGKRESERRKALNNILESELSDFSRAPVIETLGSDYGATVVGSYKNEINKVIADRFDDIRITSDLRKDLHQTLREIYGRLDLYGPYKSGVVIAGMGEEEPFPTVLEYTVGTVAAGKLRYAKTDEGRIDLDYSGRVMPFARRDTIDMILSGIHPSLVEALREGYTRGGRTKRRSPDGTELDEMVREFSEQYGDPLMTAVSALPRQDLAKMAEALVSLTAFFMRMSAGEDETVAEPIDVALLSKSDGFSWVKHKDLVRESGRLGP